MRTLVRLALACVLALGALAALALDLSPLVADGAGATPEDAQVTRDLVHRVRDVTETGTGQEAFPLSNREITSGLAFATRMVPRLRSETERTGAGQTVRFSRPFGPFWLNVEATVPAYEGRPTLAALRIGDLPLPAGLSAEAAIRAADLALGGDAGERLAAAVPRLALTEKGAEIDLVMDRESRKSLTRRVASVLRGGEVPTAAEIERHYRAFAKAVGAGKLPKEGSFLPYLRFLVEHVDRVARPGREDRVFTAALFALTKLCGQKDFYLVLGKLVEGEIPPDESAVPEACRGTRLNGRNDSRLHFVTAAALKAASTIKISYTVGEYKELIDSRRTSGFDFSDIAANAAGIRFAQTVIGTPRAAWPDLLARMTDERDVVPSYDGLPPHMTDEAFKARYGDVDTPAYAEVVQEIDRRIERLGLYRAPTEG